MLLIERPAVGEQRVELAGEFTGVVEPRDDALPPSRWTRH